MMSLPVFYHAYVSHSTTPTSVIPSNGNEMVAARDATTGVYLDELDDDALSLIISALAPEAFKLPTSFKEQFEGRAAMRKVTRSMRGVCQAWRRNVDFLCILAESTLGSTFAEYPTLPRILPNKFWGDFDHNVRSAYAPRAWAAATIHVHARAFLNKIKRGKQAVKHFEWLAAMEARKAGADAEGAFCAGAGGPARRVRQKRERKAQQRRSLRAA